MGRMTVVVALESRFRKYNPFLQASETEMYSALVDDVDTVGCLVAMDGVDESTIDNHAMPRERLPVHDVMGPIRVRGDDYVALVLGGDVSQLEYERNL